MDGRGAVEAALFSSPEKVNVEQIAERTGIPVDDVKVALRDLKKEYDERESAIMIAKIGNEYKMMLKPEYSEVTGKFAKAELTGGMMRTLSTIAYNQPVLQSELFNARGVRTYDDVRALVEMGFVSAKRVGQTKELTTTKKFSEYFGIGSTRKEDIKKWIESQAKNIGNER
ncbi:segregation and condensation protein B [Candidatus Methanoplasma termitum]|uniref:ScpB protein n=1 Tax=Candidatus Methanoplasma termitum TaxID=1577791 RepID=A0A0A7LDS2_9ARCH|nr:SMC-Scp complex subunit ScpB [Candidatus Methanoplasma termitum]AIZ57103.1 segregation and condensation protein B [Candidatus Methanoplasma termitum]